ncbi:hypothetical protein [Amycolatopsis lexingtonensis]|uniref:hypothetical protein n=1 Tax=Amycolatopsis lexingtonensis TaxID=218822 RepID=UPI003F71AB16
MAEYTDPFADEDPFPHGDEAQAAPAQSANTTNNHWEDTHVTTVPQPTAPNPFKIGFTLKAADGFAAEWLTPTVYGASAEETAQRGFDLLKALKDVGLLQVTASAAQAFREGYKGAPRGRGGAGASGASQQRAGGQQGGGQGRPQGKPEGADGPPADVEPKFCKHGEMVFRSGFSEAKQKTWKGFFCPTPKGTPDQCKAQFLR